VPETPAERIARLEATVAAHGRDLDRLGPVAGEQIKTTADVAVMEKELEDFKRWVAEVEGRLRTELVAAERRQSENTSRIEKACAAAVDRLDAGVAAKVNARAIVTVAAISAVATILAGKL
jgi:type II secretory pathway component PulJ